MISSFNILSSAFHVIPHSSIQYRKFLKLTTNDFGVSTHEYTDWTKSEAIVQPGIVSSFGGKCIELKDYKELGLDWSRRHITMWTKDISLEPDVDRNGADQIKWNGKVFSVLQVENWLEYNGWIRAYCVEQKGESDESSS